jgi:uncharacterized protein
LGLQVFNDYGLEKTGNRIGRFLQKNDPYRAYTAFLDDAEKYLILAKAGKNYTVLTDGIWLFLAIAWAAACLIGFVVVQVWKQGMNIALPKSEANAYTVQGSLVFKEKRDTFLYKTVSKTKRSTSSSGSSSSSHTSSSGRSHGGRGGKY